MQQIAFFGVGTMGTPMALNLLKAGYGVRTKVYKDFIEGPLTLQKQGGVITNTIAETVGDADLIISIVPDDRAVREIYMDAELLDNVKPGTIIIEMTSCSPDVIAEIQACYGPKGVQIVDCGVTGALAGAIEGTLGIMVSGDEAAAKQVQPVFEVLGSKITYLGRQGNAKRFKALNNLLGAINLAAAGELYRVAKAIDVDLALFYEVIKVSSGASVQFERNFPRMIDQNFEPTFTVALLRKDMGLALDMADGLSLPLAETAFRLYQNAAPFDREDCSAIVKVER